MWRKDETTGRGFALVLTKAGRARVAELVSDDPVHQEMDEHPASASSAPVLAPAPALPRAGSKLSQVIALLGRDRGTSVAELMAATGWLPHTTRAALTGLRKRGYALTRDAAEGARSIASPKRLPRRPETVAHAPDLRRQGGRARHPPPR